MPTDENAGYAKGVSGRPVALEPRSEVEGRRYSPSVARNREVVAEAFAALMPTCGSILEIGSGTGEHGVFITSGWPDLGWTFTDPDETVHGSIRAWIDHAGRANLKGPFLVDATRSDWGADVEAARFDGLFTANVIHIAPFEVAAGLFSGAGRRLTPGGRLFLYGPFGRDGMLAEGNQRFDADLKRRDARWGVRDLERDLVPLGKTHGLSLAQVAEMPKNNLSVVFERER